MDEDTQELIEALLARVGAMLEDANAIALVQGGQSQADRIELLMAMLADASALVGAAGSLQTLTSL